MRITTIRPRHGLILLFAALFLLIAFPSVSADVSIPTKTIVLIEQDGKSFTGPVSYTVSCYGYLCRDYACRPDPSYGETDPHDAEKVFSYTASCLQYGCAIYPSYYINHRHISWCDMTGTANGTPFNLPRYAENPLPDCTYRPMYDVSGNGSYYRYPPAYHACIDRNEQEKKDTCGRYIMPITWAEIENTTGLSWFANNGTYWVRTDAYLSCISQMENQAGSCGSDFPLQPVNQSDLERDPEGRVIENFCTLHLTLPPTRTVTLPVTGNPDQTPQALSGNDTGIDNPVRPAGTATQPPDPVRSLWCSLVSLLGGRCA